MAPKLREVLWLLGQAREASSSSACSLSGAFLPKCMAYVLDGLKSGVRFQSVCGKGHWSSKSMDQQLPQS